MEVIVAGEEMVARADRSLYWPRTRTLFVADLHLGKGAAFRAGNIPVPPGSTAATLDVLSRAIESVDPCRLIVLGDLWHSKSGRDDGTRQLFSRWRSLHPDLEMVLIVGNHDQKSGPLEGDGFVVEDERSEPPFFCAHHPCEPRQGLYALTGHIHPSVTLQGTGRQSLRLPCFWFGARCGVLPSFGLFTGTADVQPGKEDRVLVIAEDRVLRVQ